MTRNCKWCGEKISEAIRNATYAIYCSSACKEHAKNQRRLRPRGLEHLTCVECGVDYAVDWTGRRGSPSPCCSDECRTTRRKRYQAVARRTQSEREPQVAITHAPCWEQPTCESCRYQLPAGCCALYVATVCGPLSLAAVGEFLGVTRERVRQIEERALRKLSRVAPEYMRDLLRQESDSWHLRPIRERQWRVSDAVITPTLGAWV